MPTDIHRMPRTSLTLDKLPVIDMSVIEELREVGNNEELLQRVLMLFAKHVPQALDAVSELAERGEMDAFADTVHGLKSMCANIGARRASAICEELERTVRLGVSFDLAEGTSKLLGEVREALRAAELLKRH